MLVGQFDYLSYQWLSLLDPHHISRDGIVHFAEGGIETHPVGGSKVENRFITCFSGIDGSSRGGETDRIYPVSRVWIIIEEAVGIPGGEPVSVDGYLDSKLIQKLGCSTRLDR